MADNGRVCCSKASTKVAEARRWHVREGQCEVGFAVEDAGFARGIGHGGEEFGGNVLRLSALMSAKNVNNRVGSHIHALKPKLS